MVMVAHVMGQEADALGRNVQQAAHRVAAHGVEDGGQGVGGGIDVQG